MKSLRQGKKLGGSGFTLMELMVSSAISLLVVVVTISSFIYSLRSWYGILLRLDTDQDANIAVSRMVYGMDDRWGLRCAARVKLTGNNDAWMLTYGTGGVTPQTNSFTWSKATGELVFNPGAKIAGRNISLAQVFTNAFKPHSVVVTVRVDRVQGTLSARREIGTEISFRN